MWFDKRCLRFDVGSSCLAKVLAAVLGPRGDPNASQLRYVDLIPMRRARYVSLLLFISFLQLQAQELTLTLPLKDASIRFAVIGDSGTGKTRQYELAAKMVEARQEFPFEFVLMLGDNMYGGESPRDFEKKFERPYKALLDAGVKFYAALGNHDNPNQRFYKPFNMDGKQYYTYKKGAIRFFAIDSNYVDRAQLQWIEKELQNSDSEWKICYFHHPLYSSGARHGSDTDLRLLLEPLFIKYGVNVVLAGHEHFYERLKPQNGIYYFISGAAAKLRRGNIRSSMLTMKGFDQDLSFMLMEVAGDQLHFQVISRDGRTVDGGSLQHQAEADRAHKASQ
jgi:predicted MPP superfamily phosphohydrolase